MEIRHLGRSGLRVSAIGLGCNNFGGRLDLAATQAVLDRAIDSGITLFDIADNYGEAISGIKIRAWKGQDMASLGDMRGRAEELMGQALGENRKRIVLATKFGNPMDDTGVKAGASRRYIMSAVEASLKRLRTDYIDLYQQHRFDPRTPIEETLRAFDDLVRQGKVRYIGCCNFPGWRVAEAALTARTINVTPFVSCQNEYSLVLRSIEKELIPAAQAFNMGLLTSLPLAGGLLTGKYRRDMEAPAGTRFAVITGARDRFLSRRNFDVVEALQKFAQERGRTMLELAFSWLLARPQVTSVIAGATKPEQIDQNVKAGDWKFTADDLAEIDRITASQIAS